MVYILYPFILSMDESLRRLFRAYYEKNEPLFPLDIDRREWGFGFESKIDIRHKHFRTKDELMHFIRDRVPFYISYSVGIFQAPEARPMERKIMMGSELVFDIDVHGCPHHDDRFICNHCLSEAKLMVVYLLEEFLIPDFGFGPKDYWINFSGNRGYHVHVNSIRDLDRKERRELIDYLRGKGFDRSIFLERRPHLSSPGWFGRVARCVLKKLEEGSIRTTKANAYVGDIRKGVWSRIERTSWFKRVFEECLKESAAPVDEQVTLDVYRLIRLPNSVHGGTGFVAEVVRDLSTYDPLNSAVWLDDREVSIDLHEEVPPITIRGRSFDLLSPGVHTLPLYYSAYLVAKGAASFKDFKG
ncbi:MAG: DNA primase catalytic subunit PriS [Candidatus Asgardarchaeia archaeon]